MSKNKIKIIAAALMLICSLVSYAYAGYKEMNIIPRTSYGPVEITSLGKKYNFAQGNISEEVNVDTHQIIVKESLKRSSGNSLIEYEVTQSDYLGSYDIAQVFYTVDVMIIPDKAQIAFVIIEDQNGYDAYKISLLASQKRILVQQRRSGKTWYTNYDIQPYKTYEICIEDLGPHGDRGILRIKDISTNGILFKKTFSEMGLDPISSVPPPCRFYVGTVNSQAIFRSESIRVLSKH